MDRRFNKALAAHEVDVDFGINNDINADYCVRTTSANQNIRSLCLNISGMSGISDMSNISGMSVCLVCVSHIPPSQYIGVPGYQGHQGWH